MIEVADFWRKYMKTKFFFQSSAWISRLIALIWTSVLEDAASNLLILILTVMESQFSYPACHRHPVISSSCVLKQLATEASMNCYCCHRGCISMAHKNGIHPRGSQDWILCFLCKILTLNSDVTQCKLTQYNYIATTVYV